MKMSWSSVLLFASLDACLVQTIRQAQLSPLLIPHPFLTLWAGAVVRACVLLALTSACPGTPAWLRRADGLHSIGVLCFHVPVYISGLQVLGWSTLEQLWGWHSWPGLLQGYMLTAVAWLYQSKFSPSPLHSGPPKGESQGASLRRLLGLLWPYCRRLSFVLLLVVLSSLCEMAVPYYTGRMADWIMDEDAPGDFSFAITVMVLLTVASAVLEFICDLIYNITMSLVHMAVQGQVFCAVLKQDIAFFDSVQTGEIVSRITEDTNQMSEALSEQLSLLMWYLARLVFLFIFMMGQSWKLSVFTFMGLPVIMLIPELSGQFHQRIAMEVQKSLAKANQVATEVFSSMKTVRGFANEDGETERYRKRLDDTYHINKREAMTYAASLWTNSLSGLLLKVLMLYYGGLLVTQGSVRSGDLVSFVLYELQFTSALESVLRCYPDVKKAVGRSEKIFEYLDRTPQVPPDGPLKPERLEGCVEFKGITFAYAGRKDTPVLKNVSFRMESGKTTALVGLNSAGKTTCVRLLERFYQPQEGQILLDDQPLDQYNSQYLRSKMAVVGQESVLFARSIKENIMYGCETATEEDMQRAAKLACAHQFISKLPNGYATDAGQKGGLVSGGQKQRIAVARALISAPRLLVLDNATSDLDAETEHQVHQALLKDSNQRTILLISHKMSVVEKAHHIVVLREGEVVEQGNHEELLRKTGFYAEMVKKQEAGRGSSTEHAS